MTSWAGDDVSRYDAFPSHPLHGVAPELLEAARVVMRGGVECGDLDADVAEPLADAVVAALVEAGYVIVNARMLDIEVDVHTRGLMSIRDIAAECGVSMMGRAPSRRIPTDVEPSFVGRSLRPQPTQET